MLLKGAAPDLSQITECTVPVVILHLPGLCCGITLNCVNVRLDLYTKKLIYAVNKFCL